MNKKIVNIILLMVVLISLFSVVVESATIAEGFRAGLNTIENFFKGGWQSYERTITFVVFFFLFFSAYLIGAKKAFSENGKLGRPHMVFAFVAALYLSFINEINFLTL